MANGRPVHVRRALTGAFLAILSVTGCVAPDARGGPNLAPSSADGDGVVLGGCEGALASVFVPGVWVRSHLPAKYALAPAGDAVAQLHLIVENCRTTIIDSVDVGPSSIQVVTASIENPADGPSARGLARFLFELRTNRSALESRFRDLGAEAGVGSATRTLSPAAAGAMRLAAEVVVEGNVEYSFDGATSDGGPAPDSSFRYFFGPDPSRDYFEADWRERRGGAYAGTLEAAPGSRLSTIIGAFTSFPAAVQLVDVQRIDVSPRAEG